MSSGDRSVSAVLQDIVGNIQEIVRSEVRLAKTEVGKSLAKSRHAAMSLAIGAISGFFTIFFLLLTSVFALSRVVPNWAAALIIAISLAVVCAFAVGVGIQRLRQVRLAPVTVASLKENVAWAKQQLR